MPFQCLLDICSMHFQYLRITLSSFYAKFEAGSKWLETKIKLQTERKRLARGQESIRKRVEERGRERQRERVGHSS